MLLHYLGKLKLQIFCRYWRKSKQIAFWAASTFVIHPQILIFSVFKIAKLSPYWLHFKLSMSLFFYLFTLAINLWHRKFVTAEVTAVFVNNQHDINLLSDEDKILIKSLYLKGCTANEFPEKSWIKHGVNKLFKKLRDTRTGGQAWQTAQCPHWRKR